MRAERETRTRSQEMLGRRGILRIVFGKKHAFFGDFKILISRFEEVRLVGKNFNLDFRVLWPSNSLEMNL